MGIDPLVTLMALYLGYWLWGILGLLIAPMTAATAIRLADLGSHDARH
jgi:predicted PurR-regulated permease PerM